MTEHAGLERGYRWLLAWYPRAFWREHEEEMLAVLMADAQQGRERPSPADAADVIKSALGMRLRRLWQGPRNQAWADALAVFSVVAPLFLLAADLLEVALPYRVPGNPVAARFFGRAQIGGLPLLNLNFFDIAVGCQVIIAALVLLGLRRTALIAVAASAGYWAVARQWIPGIPYPLQLLASTVFLLEAVALIASPGPRRGRQLLTWGHGAVLVLAAAAVQAATLLYDASSPLAGRPVPGDVVVYFCLSVVLAVAAISVAVAVRMSWYFLLLLGVMLYPFVMQIAFPTNSSSNDLLGHPTPGDLALLYIPPLLLACGAILTAVLPRRSPLPMSADPDKPT
jgi:hypothetical protein